MVRVKGLVLIAICFLCIGVSATLGFTSHRESKLQRMEQVSYAKSLLKAQMACEREITDAKLNHDAKAEQLARIERDAMESTFNALDPAIKKAAITE